MAGQSSVSSFAIRPTASALEDLTVSAHKVSLHVWLHDMQTAVHSKLQRLRENVTSAAQQAAPEVTSCSAVNSTMDANKTPLVAEQNEFGEEKSRSAAYSAQHIQL